MIEKLNNEVSLRCEVDHSLVIREVGLSPILAKSLFQRRKLKFSYASVAQWPACSCKRAGWIEQPALSWKVVGSNPTGGAMGLDAERC